jgi:hypothetical protein
MGKKTNWLKDKWTKKYISRDNETYIDPNRSKNIIFLCEEGSMVGGEGWSL